MNGILVHPRTKQEEKLIRDLFDKMNIAYEKKDDRQPVKGRPNAVTRKAIEDARLGRGEKFNNLSDLFDELKR